MNLSEMSVSETNKSKNVCQNQDTFNEALDKSFRNLNNRREKQNMPWFYVYMCFFTIFFVWALILALSNPQGPDRVMHLVFAMVFSPFYVLAYAFGILQK